MPARTIPNGCAPEVVNDDAAEPGLLAGRIPGLSKIADRLTVIMEHERAIGAPPFVRPVDDCQEFAPHGKRPSVLILADLGPKTKFPTRQVNIAPFNRAHLAHPPSRRVEERHRVFQMGRQAVA